MSHLTRPLFKLAVVALFCHIVTSCQPHGNTGQDSLSDGKPLIHVTGNNSGFKVVSTRRHGPEGGFPAAQMLPPRSGFEDQTPWVTSDNRQDPGS